MKALVINAAINKLIETGGKDEESRDIVAAMLNEIKPGKGHMYFGIRGVSGDSVSGETGHGNFTIKDEKEREHKFTMGQDNYYRVGDFKVIRTDDKKGKRGPRISIIRFWEADVTTRAEESGEETPTQRWVMQLDKAGKPEWWAEQASQISEGNWVARVCGLAVRKYSYVEGWPEEGRIHDGGQTYLVR